MVCLKLGHSLKDLQKKKFAWVQKILSTYAKIITLLFKKTSQVTDINHVPFFEVHQKPTEEFILSKEKLDVGVTVHWKRISWRDKTLFPLIFHLRLDEFSLFSSSVQQQAQTSEQPVIQLCFRKRAELSMQRIGFCVNALWVTLRIFPSRRSLPRYCDSKNLSFIPPSASAALLSHLYQESWPEDFCDG